MKTPCPYCGNNPVPHRFYWCTESLNIFLTPLRQKLLYNPLSRFFKSGKWPIKLGSFFLDLGEKFGIVKRQTNCKVCKVRRAQVLWEEAQKRGIKMSELLVFGRTVDTYVAEKSQTTTHETQSTKHKARIIFSGLPRPAGYVNKWLDLMDDKWLLKKAMTQNGLPVPMGASCSSFNQARKVFNSVQNSPRPPPPRLDCRVETGLWKRGGAISVIVKPRAGSRGRHSTTFVFNEDDLKKAFKIAKQLCYWVVVEEQLFGPVYRATIINGHLAGVLRGDPPEVTGDGSHNISQLINIKNTQPHPGVKDIVPDKAMETFLSRQLKEKSEVRNAKSETNSKSQIQNFKLNPFEYTLKAGARTSLSEKIGVNYGGSSSEDFDICHPDNKELFLRAARVLGDPIVGFDFIIQDIFKSYKQQRAGFIEVNSLPFINLHHDPLLGAPRNAAALVWDMLGW